MRAVALVLVTLLASLAFIWWRAGTSPTQPVPIDAAPKGDAAAGPLPPDLAAPPPRPGLAPVPKAPGEPAPPSPTPRRMAYVRLVAVDATRNEPVDPHSYFQWSFAEGCDEQLVAAEASPGARTIAALLPVGADASTLRVSIDGWGFLPFTRSFAIHAADGAAVEELRVALEPVAAAAWTGVRVVLAGAGAVVTEPESLQLVAMPRTSPCAQPSFALEFSPGSPRERELWLPFSSAELVLETTSRMLIDGGRRIWVVRPLVRVESTIRLDDAPSSFVVTRPSTAVLELELRYPTGDLPRQLECWGSWRQSGEAGVGGPHRSLVSTFDVTVRGAPDVVRLERYAGQLTGLRGHAFGFVSSVTPSGPLELRLSETTRAVIEFRRAPIPPPK